MPTKNKISIEFISKKNYASTKSISIIFGFIIISIIIYIIWIFFRTNPEPFTNEELVIPNPIGGLGNQMFFVAHAYVYGQKHNKQLKIERKKDYYSIGKPRPTYYDTIFYSIPLITKMPGNYTEVDENNIAKLDSIPGNILISGGYFQKTELLKPYLSDFAKLFINPQYNDIIDDIIKTNNINIAQDWLLHVRLPDDWTPPDSVNISLPNDFINIKEFVSTLPDESKIIVFSNDISKTKDLLEIKDSNSQKYIFLDFPDVETLYVMTRMIQFIPSPSTFNLWGVMLSMGLGNNVKIKLVWNSESNSYLTDFHQQYMQFKDNFV